MSALCPCCGQAVSPVYCAASTDAAPLLLAWTLAGAGRALGVHPDTIKRRARPWRDGLRLVAYRRALSRPASEGRARLVAFLLAHPDSTARDAAAACRVSPSTARDVRRELVEAGHLSRLRRKGSAA